MNGLDQVSFMTDADQDHVVRAFRHAFFNAPTLADHFKPTPLGHFRSMLRWEPHEIMGCPIGARLAEVSLHRKLEDLHGIPRFEVGETIGLDCEPEPGGLRVRVFVDSNPSIGPVEVSSPLVLHTYVHEMCTELDEGGHAVQDRAPGSDYHVPPGAPPGWPFGR
ncbi:MAG TPA: hypothetical protein VG405_13210 [Solirubrobacteraceae bacterium]|nr:hypothetical protein [Solirubrobacteraceae bacterium]